MDIQLRVAHTTAADRRARAARSDARLQRQGTERAAATASADPRPEVHAQSPITLSTQVLSISLLVLGV